jgi:hypothetical protein
MHWVEILFAVMLALGLIGFLAILVWVAVG